MDKNQKHLVVSYGTESLDNREEILCAEEKEVEGCCNLVDQRYNPETIYVFTRPHTSEVDGYFWKGGHILVNGK